MSVDENTLVNGSGPCEATPETHPAPRRWKVGDLVTLDAPGCKAKQFRVTAVDDTNARTGTINYTVEPVDGDPAGQRAMTVHPHPRDWTEAQAAGFYDLGPYSHFSGGPED